MVNVIQIIHSFKPTAESVAIEMINKPNPLAASRFDLIILYIIIIMNDFRSTNQIKSNQIIKNHKKSCFISYMWNFKNWVISIVFPFKLHRSAVTRSVPDEKALSADTLDDCTVK